MNIRRYKKDHLRELAPELTSIQDSAPNQQSSNNSLLFWTRHELPTLVNLQVFANGDDGSRRVRGSSRLRRTFSGRPLLIAELAPALYALLECAAPRTAGQYMQALRDWWVLFDLVESQATEEALPVVQVRRVSDISEIHRQRAFDEGMERGAFGSILASINMVRRTAGLRPLLWGRPEPTPAIRHLPPEWQVRQVRIHIKHGWFAALHRWETADELLAGRPAASSEEARLLKNYELFRSTVARENHPRPPAVHFWDGGSPQTFANRGFSVSDMLRGFYPDAEDIRYAFHLCLASTGWNPAVLLSLDANSKFTEAHPKDPTRYLLRGYKARSKNEQVTEGLYKSRGSAGVILMTLMQRTERLRERLRLDLKTQEQLYRQMLLDGTSPSALDAQRQVVAKLNIGVSSVWLYVTPSTDDIVWLNPHDTSYSRGVNREGRGSFLDGIVAHINSRQPPDRQVSRLTAGDFRDAFAAFAYSISGGMVLYVMRALGHKSLRTTQRYLDNTLLNAQSARLYQTFSNAVWYEIRVHKRLDPTLVAMYSRDGVATGDQRERLAQYRTLRRSRIGIGCKDPTSPPQRIAPNFRANGKAMCHVHRCMLCLEHAVVFPDSLPGLCKRIAELKAIRSRMSATAFLESSFDEELENTELAVGAFDQREASALVQSWEQRISDGEHRVVDLDGR